MSTVFTFYISEEWVLLFIRLILGLVMIYYGYPKVTNFKNENEWMGDEGFRPWWFWGSVVAAVEFFGGLAVILGIFSELAAFLFAIQMFLGAIWKVFKARKSFRNYSYNLLALATALVIVVFGPGAYAAYTFSISRAYAAVFDADLIPGADNLFSVGLQPIARWKDARFSGILGVGVNNERESEVNASDRLVLGPIVGSDDEGGQLKLLSPAAGKYLVIDNYRNSLRIIANDGTSEKAHLTVASSSGNVTIGESSALDPGERLEVVGNIISKGTEWTLNTISGSGFPTTNTWQSVTYGNGVFVAVSNNGASRVMVSADGVNWTAYTGITPDSWSSLTYGNGLFVAVATTVAGGGLVMTSPDGITWTSRSAAVTTNNWRSVTYGNGRFVAVADGPGLGDRAMYSTDGISWLVNSGPDALPDNSWQSITYGNGVFVAVASCIGVGNCVRTSTDGISWSPVGAVPENSWRSVTYGNGLFVAVADSGTDRVMTSLTGTGDWTVHDNPSVDDKDWRSVTYGNGLFVALGNGVGGTGSNNRVMTSPDGISWILRPHSASADLNWKSVAYGNGRFVAVIQGTSGTNKVLTSGKLDRYELKHDNIYQGGMKILGGNVGIGTVNPLSTLHVVGTLTITDDITLDTNNKGVLGKFAGGSSASILKVNASDHIEIGSNSSLVGAARVLAGNSSGYITLETAMSERVRIDQAGRVGIGTAVPQTSLHIADPATSRLALSAGTLDATNPAWVLTDQSSDGLLKIQSTSDYSTYTDRVTIDSSGMVGIGTAPTTYRLTLPNTSDNAGKGVANGWIGLSSVRWKTNIQDIKDALQKVLELRGVTFDWKPENGGTRDIGLIAEEVGKILPDIVEWEENGVDAIGLDYGRLVAVLIEAIKEQQAQAHDLDRRLKRLGY